MNPYICKKIAMDSEKADEFFERLKVQLQESSTWPSDYLYKFIVPSEKEKIAQIHRIFDNTGAVIESKKSKMGKYTSLSVTVNRENPEEVIQKYREVAEVKGVISL